MRWFVLLAVVLSVVGCGGADSGAEVTDEPDAGTDAGGTTGIGGSGGSGASEPTDAGSNSHLPDTDSGAQGAWDTFCERAATCDGLAIGGTVEECAASLADSFADEPPGCAECAMTLACDQLAAVLHGHIQLCDACDQCTCAECVDPGTACTSSDCCDGSVCVEGTSSSLPVCSAECVANTECVSGCCVPLSNSDVSVCAPEASCAEDIATASSTGCGTVILVANDGRFLGVATSNELATDGVCNEFSDYGNEFSATSIFNEFGTYGSPYSQLSAYNEFTSTPPVLVCDNDGTVLNPVTKNTVLPGAIDPDSLCQVLASVGL